jgi:hypothetical protein
VVEDHEDVGEGDLDADGSVEVDDPLEDHEGELEEEDYHEGGRESVLVEELERGE